jgi:hypothetical protein
MPMTLEEYHRGQVYSVAETSKRETGGGDGIEMIKSEQFQDGLLPSNAPTGLKLDSGQYTLKKYHINKLVELHHATNLFMQILKYVTYFSAVKFLVL